MAFHTLIPPTLRDLQALRTLGVWQLLLQALLTGGITGAVIGLFRRAFDLINMLIVRYVEGHSLADPWVGASIFAALLVLAALAWLFLRYEPLVASSGIPQVELTVAGHLPMRWATVIWAKFLATLVSLTGGLSVGREGPCIQMGAAVGCGVGHIWHEDRAATMPRYLIGGSAAGLTAAFGAPAAGLCFAFEEMKTPISAPMLIFTSVAAFAAWFVIQVLFGFGLIFPFSRTELLSLPQWWIVPLLGAVTGMLGVLYNGILIRMVLWADRSRLPQPLRVLTPFLLSGLLLYFYPQVLASFGVSAPALEKLPLPLSALLLLLGVKVIFSCVSSASGVSGGLLMPILLGGAIAGACVASMLLSLSCISPDQIATVLLVSMAGLFASTVRAPLTGTALVIEMTNSFQNIPAVLVAAYIAALTANSLGSQPVYDSLKQRAVNLEKAHQARIKHGKAG
ncbi:ClC family H(+)/Cl(-) exchange transporter [Desulfovibrio sp. ZJ200]|uniref:ClC family H(+)/Cl(-) exchange transporter n=1 Tax=Desulfovibrio sp. ZJ200 TaxID=2709792 RepID=UPI001F14B9E1|nr:ClC family H(+)/Cl(-) exchange transporter [Desulfovibrio sp. ZJ200]